MSRSRFRWISKSDLIADRPGRRLTPWLAGLGAFFLVVSVVGVVRLIRGPSPSPPLSEVVATSTTGPTTIVLPTLPSDQELYPDLFDEQGCLRTGPDPDDVDCGNQVPYNEEFDGPPETNPVRNLMGFQGQYYATDLTSKTVVVLPETVAAVPGVGWEAFGLVRNETEFPVGEVMVRALLSDKGGVLLGVAEALVPISELRPGEPGPFHALTDVSTEAVAEVTWEVVTGEAPAASRALMIQRYWEVPYGDRPRWDTDPAQPPFPYLAFGSVTNLGDVAIDTPTVAAAWLDENGRVIWIVTTPVRDLSPSADASKELVPGGIADFYLIVDDPEMAPQLLGPTSQVSGMIIWGYSG